MTTTSTRGSGGASRRRRSTTARLLRGGTSTRWICRADSSPRTPTRRTWPRRSRANNDTGLHPGYPFCSPCGKEMNFILPADHPFVFHTLSEAEGGEELGFGGDLSVAFDAAALRLSRRSGRLYHTIPKATKRHPYSKEGGGAELPRAVGAGMELGLLRSAIVVRLADRLGADGEGFAFEGKPIPFIGDEEEPYWGFGGAGDPESESEP
mmetsp:Transcript_8121/g.23164  ORF Transcript_8121/g.23164 Transcript_8121/m.23164 type:complete len:209 (-) Transcript_8121:88-714(-)